MAPGGGPPGTVVRLSGAGCFGTGAGVSIDTKHPEGHVMARHVAQTLADGTWSTMFSMDVPATVGNYGVAAVCVTGASRLPYRVLTFTMLGPDDGSRPGPGPNLPTVG